MSRARSLPDRLKTMRFAFEIACGIVLTLFTALVLYSVIMRYFFNNPPIWGEDIPKLLFVWLSFVGGGLAYMLGYNIRMANVVEKFTRPWAVAVELTVRTLTLAMLAVIVWYSIPILELASYKNVLSTGLSDVWTYLALPVGAVLLACNEVVRMVLAVLGESESAEDDSAMHSGM
jgi:TRAP-type C4-dicarboxylate transport system permease small subunit